MRIIRIITAALVAVTLAATPMAALAGKGKGKSGGSVPPATTVVTTLSAEEIADLQWMREEEKLARDIYDAMSARWSQPIFANIARSEQTHFEAIGEKLVLFGIDDPAALTAPGVFTDQTLQSLYNELFDQGWASYEGALEAGVTIEETDIADLDAAIAATDVRTLLKTYQNLLKASEKHLKSFEKLLSKLPAK
ncbi:MAG: DUF2202 domain-containing protein [Gammaproteobacteria bacterium]|nr:DUF2202 domain-containing protein [Gammaproteobacteria bacterium]